MKHYTVKIIPQRTERVVEFRTCDLCNRRITSEGSMLPEVNNVKIKHEIGTNYGQDGGGITKAYFDVCPECWASVILPWFLSKGCKPNMEEEDF